MNTPMVLLGASHLRGLKRGDTFTTEGFFQGVTDKGVKWTLVGGNQEVGEYLFDTSYFRVRLGQFRALIKSNGQVEVEEV